jgi:hypothetical protein
MCLCTCKGLTSTQSEDNNELLFCEKASKSSSLKSATFDQFIRNIMDGRNFVHNPQWSPFCDSQYEYLTIRI